MTNLICQPKHTAHPLKQYHNHHSVVEISKNSFDHNIAYYKKNIGNHNALALVIKGNGYGHGLVPMGLLCQQNELVNWLCVAHYEEAFTLVQAGITKHILVLNYANAFSMPPLFNNIHFMVDTIEYATFLNNIGKLHSHQFSVHIKIDTGLSRLGIQPDTIKLFVQQLKYLSYIKIDGVFSHFIASDNNQKVTKKQFAQFVNAAKTLLTIHPQTSYIHMSNTASITTVDYPLSFNFFRIGLGMYGFGNHDNKLIPVLTWKTCIIAIKTIPAHSYVSYACTYKTTRTTRIALLPVGYSDGYQLRFSNKASVLINGHLAPVIGRIGMNITIVDISHCTAAIGDEVILLGSANGVKVTDLAYAVDIYNVREIFTGIDPLIPRITI